MGFAQDNKVRWHFHPAGADGPALGYHPFDRPEYRFQ